MELAEQTKKICQSYDIKPARTRGQNFLITETVYDEMVNSTELTEEDTVLEIGPGLGFLTERLAKKAGKVIAVELDDKLFMILGERLKKQGIGNVEILNKDILKVRGEDLGVKRGAYKVVANLPYNITSIFLRRYLSDETIKPKTMVLMLQKEVAERIAARAGEMSLLAVSVQFYAQPEIISYVAKNNFWPEPEVDSAIIKLSARGGPALVGEVGEKEFFRMVRIGFSSKRKMLKNNLASGYHIGTDQTIEIIKKAGFSEKIRAQELSVEDWLKLFGCLGQNML